MSCVEGEVVAQVPGPNQYWEHIKSKDRAYFIGRDPDGRMVWQCEGDCIEVGNLDWTGWRHIPGCTGWDWEPDQVEEFPQYWTTLSTPSSSIAYIKRIDQSTLVSVCKDGTEVNDSVIEWKTDRRTRLTEQEALALLDKPDKRAEVAQNTIERIKRFDPASVPAQERAEQWPRFFINPDPDLKWYIRAENCIDAPLVYLEDGRTDTCKAEWTDIICFLGSGTWVDVTEAEALAKIAVDKAPAEVWPKYYVGYQWNDKDAYIRYDGPESSGVWVNWHGTETVFAGDHYSEVAESVASGSWRQVTEAEAKARVTKAIEPAPSVQFLPVAPEMDWVVQDRVPARNNIDEWCWCKPGKLPEKWSSGFGGWSSTIMHGHVDGDEVLHLRCRRKDLPEIAPEMEWVDITDRDQLLRIDIDQVYRCVDTFGCPIGWEFVRVPGLTLNKASSDLSAARCRRKDLPVVESPDDWVVQDKVPARPGIDERQWTVDGVVNLSWADARCLFYSNMPSHGFKDSSGGTLHLRCRRKDLPNIESPEDWVTQDRVDARPRIDQAWWSYAEPNVDKSKWSWWTVANSGGASGRKHGYRTTDGQMLNLRCKRKDLPPIPAPVEETFPQWYILKESEWMPGVTLWAIKRTGDETCIRYAFDGGEELSAANETWYGGTDAWRKCNPAEAFERLGILVEEHLPAVPSDKRRVPVKLWVTYRLNDEGGDWPVRATQADQTCQNWKEIKFDGNGAFIEVEQ